MYLKAKNNVKQTGQTIIETVVAIFILVSGIAAAVGLAIFALSSSENVTKQMIAVGLAREGVEGVKNMRDTNWLRDTLTSDCYNPATGQNDATCYKNWLGTGGAPLPFCIDPTSNLGNCNGVGSPTMEYYLGFDPAILDFWDLERQITTDNYGINFNSNISDVTFKGFYSPSDATTGSSVFFRKIILFEEDGVSQYGSGAGNPFNKNTGPRVLVRAQVWWTDKKCPESLTWPGTGKCSVELQTYLTNWKYY